MSTASATPVAAPVQTRPDRVIFIEWSDFVLTWPLIPVGFLMGLLMPFIGSNVASLVWAVTLMYITLAVCFDIDLKALVILTTFVVITGLLIWMAKYELHIPVIQRVLETFQVQHWKMTSAMMLGLATLHTAVFLFMAIHRRLYYRWIVTLGQMQKNEPGVGKVEIPLDQNHRCVARFRCQLDRLLLWNGGDLVIHVKTDEGMMEMRIIRNVFGPLEALDDQIDEFEAVVTSQ